MIKKLNATFASLLAFRSLGHGRLVSLTFTRLSGECQWLGVFAVEHDLEVAHCFGKTMLISLLDRRPCDWGWWGNS